MPRNAVESTTQINLGGWKTRKKTSDDLKIRMKEKRSWRLPVGG